MTESFQGQSARDIESLKVVIQRQLRDVESIDEKASLLLLLLSLNILQSNSLNLKREDYI
jgi:hypothetical protein